MRIKVILQVSAGLILLGIGAAGLFIPVLPTTPFVIGAAACFACAPKLRARMMRLPFFAEHIRNYQERTGLSGKNVAVSLGFLWVMLLISCLLVQLSWLRGVLAAVGVAVTIHILWIARSKQASGMKKEDRCA